MRSSNFCFLVSFLRSFSTKFELFIDFIGLIASAAAGAAQVCLNGNILYHATNTF